METKINNFNITNNIDLFEKNTFFLYSENTFLVVRIGFKSNISYKFIITKDGVFLFICVQLLAQLFCD